MDDGRNLFFLFDDHMEGIRTFPVLPVPSPKYLPRAGVSSVILDLHRYKSNWRIFPTEFPGIANTVGPAAQVFGPR